MLLLWAGLGWAAEPEAGSRPFLRTINPSYIHMLAAGAWRTPVCYEEPRRRNHQRVKPEYWMPVHSEPEMIMGGPSLRSGLEAAITSYNRSQKAAAEGQFTLALTEVSGRLVLRGAEVQVSGRWEPAMHTLDFVIPAQPAGGCHGVADRLWKLAVKGTEGLDRSWGQTAVMGQNSYQCAAHEAGPAREHLMAVLEQLEEQSGDLWYYRLEWEFMAPTKPCRFGEDGTNAAGECNSRTLSIWPLIDQEMFYDHASHGAWSRGYEDWVRGFRVPRQPGRPELRPVFLPEMGPPEPGYRCEKHAAEPPK